MLNCGATKRLTRKFLDVGTYIKKRYINYLLLAFRLKYLSTWRTFQMRAKILFMQSVTNVSLHPRPAHKFWSQIIFVREYTQHSVQIDLRLPSASQTPTSRHTSDTTNEISSNKRSQMIVKADSRLGPSNGLFNLQHWGNTDLRKPVAVDKAKTWICINSAVKISNLAKYWCWNWLLQKNQFCAAITAELGFSRKQKRTNFSQLLYLRKYCTSTLGAT
jgi:hypothetical protein